MNEREKNYVEVDILELLKSVWHYKFIVISFVMVATILAGIYVNFFTRDTYTANGTLYVGSRSDTSGEQISQVQKSEIDAARTLSSTYIETLKTRTFLKSVSAQVGNRYTWKEINKKMTLSDINDTELISVEITTNSAYDSYKLVKSLLELAPDTLMKVSKGGSIEILDNAELPSKPNDKGLVKKIILAAFVGGVLAVGLIFMLTFFDNKIHKSEDIEKRYDVSILGVLDN